MGGCPGGLSCELYDMAKELPKSWALNLKKECTTTNIRNNEINTKKTKKYYVTLHTRNFQSVRGCYFD